MNNYSIIPQPVSIEYLNGSFKSGGLPRVERGGAFQSEAQIFIEQLHQTWGGAVFGDQGFIRLEQTDLLTAENYIHTKESLNAIESYRLEILTDGITISASSETGAYRGLQTLRQLFLSGFNDGCLFIPCGKIEDRPRFHWRGFMLDCSRYFYSIEFIKKLLDALSLQHINIFHWHLSDDQGWRLPVASYPLLAEIGSKRREQRLSGEFSGGFIPKRKFASLFLLPPIGTLR
jgi:hexosaminidase